ncbi:MAG: hypothetical protein OSB16_05295 [Planktomarina sp.]|nr:hypothetical protein [Planktomarina sp.]MDT2056567.1 hypothetical protein [Planktomarina sp.]MDT2072445.1 hypothetical protein [Planktomarina sp.]MDT2078011.1 hypothetical protein [Planktomarina sp.]HAJ84371.1 hypothetical protein [Paracoccaceae bacterium]
MLTVTEIEQMFTRSDGSYVFARWGRPICPVVFGVLDETLSVVKSAIEAVCIACGHSSNELDPELGSNLMMFFFSDWDELRAVPNLDQLIPDLSGVVDRLQMAQANQYRAFRFDDAGAIQACFVFLRVDEALEQLSADSLALSQAVQAMLLWSQAAFSDRSPLAVLETGTTVLHPEITAVLLAAYDPIMPARADDPSHALRMDARIQLVS